jgi:dihydropyrimidinase
MAYPGSVQSSDADIFRVMRHASSTGALVMMHAENGTVIELLREEAAISGRSSPVQHALTRPPALEAEAVHRATRLAEVAGVPVYIVHLSSADALREVRSARAAGRNVFAETCPQYLFLDQDDLEGDDFDGAKYVCSPPLRPHHHQDALWEGLAGDDLQLVATDHCPFCLAQKQIGAEDFRLIPNGIPGVEHRVELLYEGGVAQGRISVPRWVEICSVAPAKLFGLFPRKGSLQPGSDADIVVFDATTERVLSAATHHMTVDYSCFEGVRVSGSVAAVWSRGAPVIAGGNFVGRVGHGQYLRRSLSGSLQ